MIRTDLALEAANLSGESDLPGIEIRRTKKHGLTLTTVTVLDETGSRAIGKPPGRYITLETDPIGETALTGSEEAALLGESLGALLPSDFAGGLSGQCRHHPRCPGAPGCPLGTGNPPCGRPGTAVPEVPSGGGAGAGSPRTDRH